MGMKVTGGFGHIDDRDGDMMAQLGHIQGVAGVAGWQDLAGGSACGARIIHADFGAGAGNAGDRIAAFDSRAPVADRHIGDQHLPRVGIEDADDCFGFLRQHEAGLDRVDADRC